MPGVDSLDSKDSQWKQRGKWKASADSSGNWSQAAAADGGRGQQSWKGKWQEGQSWQGGGARDGSQPSNTHQNNGQGKGKGNKNECVFPSMPKIDKQKCPTFSKGKPESEADQQLWHRYPQQLFRVLRGDFDDSRVKPHPIKNKDKNDLNFKIMLYTACLTSHQKGRNPLYCWMETFEKAQKRLRQARAKGTFQPDEGFIVSVDVWKLCEENIWSEQHLIDLSNREAQQAYFDDECFDVGLLKYQRDNQEWCSRFKGDDQVIRKMIV